MVVGAVVMRYISLPNEGGGNAATREDIDTISQALAEFVDPAEIPSVLVEKTVTHLATAAFAPLGPPGLVIAVFVGKLAGELTHQALDAGRNPAAIQRAESAIELADGFADARIGQLAESEPFREYVSGLLSRSIAAIIHEDNGVASAHRAERLSDRAPTIAAVVVAYEVETPAITSGSALSGDSTVVSVRPASFAVLECVPAEAVASRWRRGSYEFLRLVDGTLIKRRIDGGAFGPWSWVSG